MATLKLLRGDVATIPALADGEPGWAADVFQFYIGSTGGNVLVSTASPLTTKGDLYTYTTQAARLPVGNDGEVLTADSSSPTGLSWLAAGAADLVWNEEPTGVCDGINTVFVLDFAPSPANALLLRNSDGILLRAGGGYDFTISGQTITFNAGCQPDLGDWLLATYDRGGGSAPLLSMVGSVGGVADAGGLYPPETVGSLGGVSDGSSIAPAETVGSVGGVADLAAMMVIGSVGGVLDTLFAEHHWRFDENTGTTGADTGDNPVTATGVSAWVATGLPTVLGGNVSAGDLNGVGPVTFPTEVLQDPCTITGWAKVTATTAQNYLLYGDGSNGTLIIASNNILGRMECGRFNLADYAISAVGSVPMDTWFHWAFRLDSGNIEVFVDGVSVATHTIGGAFVGSASYDCHSSDQVGLYDDYRVYNYALTDAQIAAIAAGTL